MTDQQLQEIRERTKYPKDFPVEVVVELLDEIDRLKREKEKVREKVFMAWFEAVQKHFGKDYALEIMSELPDEL